MALRGDGNVTGINRGGLTHKVSLYADDLLLLLSKPHVSIPMALELISMFGKFSGYKINQTKSLIFPANDQARQLSFEAYPLTETREAFTYLGVSVTPRYKDLFNQNFKPALERAKQDLTRWSTLPISLAGRINSVKMTIMPRFLFLFQTVPVFIPKSFFKELDKSITAFIWNKKVPRTRREFLERQKDVGGLGLPNFMKYYWAANVHKLMYWMSAPPENGEVWVEMEQHSADPVSLSSLVCAPLPLSKQRLTNNPIVTNSLKIWSQFRTHIKHRQALSAIPITANALFPLSLIDSVFRVWSGSGLGRVKDLFKEGVFMSFDQMVRDFNIPRSHFFRYMQIRAFVKKHFPSFPSLPRDSWVDEWLGRNPLHKGAVSRLYSDIQEIRPTSLDHIKTAWEGELGVSISDDSWQFAVEGIHSTSVCIRHGLLQFKVLHRLHLSKSRLARIYPEVDPTCSRCLQAPATLSHMFWSCPKLGTFWSSIFETFSLICDKEISPDPVTAIFGVVPDQVDIANTQHDIIAFSSLLA